MKSISNAWPKLVFIILPLLIIAIEATVLTSERLQSDTERAIRSVRENPSRKEGFSVQQYLYTTVYHRKSLGEAINIEGWQAERSSEPQSTVTVRFGYSDGEGDHVAIWMVNLSKKKVIPQNELARHLSWH